jgi:peroxiredoxin Q/BCP
LALRDLFDRPETLRPGERAPDFSLPDANGDAVRLSSFRGRPVVVYFYPKDDTPGCTLEACTFRDQYEDFVEAGAAVIGISSDSSDSHRRFAARHRLPFTLLSDRDGAVRKRYRVPSTLGLLPGRVTFVIDADGVVRHVFDSQLAAARHATEALEALYAAPPRAAGRKPHESGGAQS